MFKQTAKLFFLLVCFYAFNSRAQISVTSTVVCLPSGITFSVTSGSSYSWNFGNSQTSTLQNPSVAYTTPGNYTVTCLVGGTTSYSIVIKVAPKPTPAFSIAQPASGCAPKTVTVTSTTSYSYPTPGSYSITLSVTDANGCSDNTTIGTVNVSAPPSVIISSNPSPLGACSAPYSATFSGSNCISGSPTGGGLTYNWSFPGGSTTSSSLQNPGTITYNVTGNYTASLTVTDNNNCTGSTAVNFSVNQPSLSITAPSTICLGSNFNVTANSNISQVFWNFGSATPGSSLTLSNVSSTVSPYFAPGVYTISATTIPAPGSTCSASQTKTVYVEQVTAQFTLTPPSMTCSPTMTIGFINQSSSNVVSWSWLAPYYV
ncbi:MAG: domain containing protein, partial [Bacteroidetes bacterium]|nr:domain containing protein [Bacteroidota bacterium]